MTVTEVHEMVTTETNERWVLRIAIVAAVLGLIVIGYGWCPNDYTASALYPKAVGRFWYV
jgi:cytochrome bd-type quinol oxidase subunit 1